MRQFGFKYQPSLLSLKIIKWNWDVFFRFKNKLWIYNFK